MTDEDRQRETIEETPEIQLDPVTGGVMKQFRLVHGCIRQDNSITSRDSSYPEYFDSLEDARASLKKQKRFYAKMGYKIWFANFAEKRGTEYVGI